MKTAFTQESMSPEANVHFHTGLPSFSTLMAIFNFVAPFVPRMAHSVLPQFQQYMMTLMKVCLHLLDQDLTYRLGVSQSTVSKTWQKWVDAMFIRLKHLIKWPTREQLKKAMSSDFKRHFNKCVCIIDCFEVFCEQPSDLKATYFNYRHYI